MNRFARYPQKPMTKLLDSIVSRREFMKKNALVGLGTLVAATASGSVIANTLATKPAALGGTPAWSPLQWPKWPQWNPQTDEPGLLEVMRSGVWSRANKVMEFEKEWAKAVGTKRALTVVNGTNALVTAISQFDIQAGDEVLVPPYTFVATITAILSNGALPVFVDIDRETFQIDPGKIEAKITSRTKAIIPVHIMGLPCDMDPIMAIAKKHTLVVIEDACQAHLAEYGGKRVGSIGNAGCFSFQNSKNLPIGEGGAVVSDDDAFIDRCFSYTNFGTPYGTFIGAVGAGSLMQGTKLRFSEAIGLAQLKRLDAQTTTRNDNAAYLKAQIENIPGIMPYRLYPKVNRAAYHLFPFRYNPEGFKGLSREKFLTALRLEGIPCSSGYTVLNTQPFLNDTFQTPAYQKVYPAELLDLKKYNERNHCPENEKLCNEAVWFTQNLLLGTRTDMDAIATAITKVHKNAEQIKAKI